MTLEMVVNIYCSFTLLMIKINRYTFVKTVLEVITIFKAEIGQTQVTVKKPCLHQETNEPLPLLRRISLAIMITHYFVIIGIFILILLRT